jgi:hypothetical protein
MGLVSTKFPIIKISRKAVRIIPQISSYFEINNNVDLFIHSGND